MNFEQARFNMVEQQIRPWEVLDPGVLGLLFEVKRELFVPAVMRSLASMTESIEASSSLNVASARDLVAPTLGARMTQASSSACRWRPSAYSANCREKQYSPIRLLPMRPAISTAFW